jgi:hypothetical protein
VRLAAEPAREDRGSSEANGGVEGSAAGRTPHDGGRTEASVRRKRCLFRLRASSVRYPRRPALGGETGFASPTAVTKSRKGWTVGIYDDKAAFVAGTQLVFDFYLVP